MNGPVPSFGRYLDLIYTENRRSQIKLIYRPPIYAVRCDAFTRPCRGLHGVIDRLCFTGER
jgi:hypothetical protein